MHTDDPRFRHNMVNGGSLLIPDAEGWKQLRIDPSINDFPLPTQTWIWQKYAFVQRYPELSLGFIEPTYPSPWSPCVILNTEVGLQRVHLERLTCTVCGWSGVTANPTDSTLYLFVAETDRALQEAFTHPIVPCPRCGSRLPRHPIWTEPLPEQGI